MARRTQKIDELLAVLENTDGDPIRLDVLRRTQRFKRSWVELAEALVNVRRDGSHKGWGYEDFYEYCTSELQLRRATIDKLTISYSTLEKHAPQVLQWDGVSKVVPSYEAVGYYSRALDEVGEGKADRGPKRASKVPGGEIVEQLRSAVFNEGQTLAELRKRFDPLLRPKPSADKELEIVQQADRLARRLAELLPELDGVATKRVHQVEVALGALRQDLAERLANLRERSTRERARSGAPRKPPPRRTNASA